MRDTRSEPEILSQIGPTASRKDSLLDVANRRYTSLVDVKTMLSLKDVAQMVGSQVLFVLPGICGRTISRRAM